MAKAEAFCKGVIEELAVRGVLNSSSGKEQEVTKAAGSDAAQTQQQQHQHQQREGVDVTCSQGSCLGSQETAAAADAVTGPGSAGLTAAAAAAAAGDDVSDDTGTQLDSSQTGHNMPAAAAAGQTKQQQAAGSAAAAAAAAAAVGGKKGAIGASAGKAKVKGPPLVYPASRPIITCAAIEQVNGYGCCCCCWGFCNMHRVCRPCCIDV